MNAHKVKSVVESIFGNIFYLEPSANLQELGEFITSVRPIGTNVPLVRIGPEGDGAYLLPDDFIGLDVCVSPGVSTEVGFDLEMAKMGIHVYMADASVSGPPINHERFNFTKKFLAVHENEKNIRLDTLCESVPSNFMGDRILQMDIEGAEYGVLLDASEETLKRFRILVIEFHSLTRLYGRFPSEIIKSTFAKLLQHFYVVHIHPNNVCTPTTRGQITIPPVMEFTFLRKDRVTMITDEILSFPHSLDRDNVPEYPSVDLPECWR